MGKSWDFHDIFVRLDLSWTHGTHIAWTLGVVEGCPQSGKVLNTFAHLYMISKKQFSKGQHVHIISNF